MTTTTITEQNERLKAQQVVENDLEYICTNLNEEFPELAGRRLLITGGAGFLGHYLVQSALYWNRSRSGPPIDVTVFDSYIRGVPDWLKQLEDNPHLHLRTHNLAQPLPAEMGEFEYIIHAASIASPTYYRKDPIGTMDANINGLRNLLDYALGRIKSGKAFGGFLFYSSSEIYGDPSPENIPTPETYRGLVSCTGPRACYDEAKRYGETLCVNFAQQYNVPVKSARPFNNYGPGLKITDRRVLPDYARDVLNFRDIVMLSDGSPRRTFCYVADAICGYYKILIKAKPGEAYNIGVENPEISMLELAERIVAQARVLFGYQGKIVRQQSADRDYLLDNPSRRCPIIDKARKQLGYNPSIQIDEGLRRSLLWYAGNRVADEA
jgi:nucleoside-diphosphate-sugar epimerase